MLFSRCMSEILHVRLAILWSLSSMAFVYISGLVDTKGQKGRVRIKGTLLGNVHCGSEAYTNERTFGGLY